MAPGDDQTAQETAAALRAAVERFGTVLEWSLDDLDRTGVPVSSATLLSGGRLVHHGNGYGASAAAARIGGLGELVERVVGAHGVARLRRDATTATRRELVARLGEEGVVDPRLLALPAGSEWSPDRPVEWVEVHDVRTGAPVRVPAELVASGPDELGSGPAPLLPPVTNGLGAGLDADRALAHGLGEVLQRHTNGLRFRALDRLSRAVDPDALTGRAAEVVAALRAVGVEPVLRHAVTELGTCSVWAMGLDDDPPGPMALTACGEAADPDPGTAFAKALHEYAHSRARKLFCFGDQARALRVAPPAYVEHLAPVVGDERAAAQMRRWATWPAADVAAAVLPGPGLPGGPVGDLAALAPAGPGPAGTDPSAVLAHLLGQLADQRVLAALTEVDGVVVAKVLVTGLEVETLSHGRIGEAGSRTSLEHDLDLVRVGDAPAGEHRARVHLTPQAQERLGGPVWFSHARATEIVSAQYPQYREPGRHSVVVA